MSQRQPSDFCLSAHGDGIFNGAVSPPDLAGVLIQGELRVMDNKVGPSEKFAMPAILAFYLTLSGCEVTRKRLMI
jgi:hypothetical protein